MRWTRSLGKWAGLVVGIMGLGMGSVGAERAWADPWARDADGNLPVPYMAVPNVCAWPNLTMLPDGSIAASIHDQPNHGTTESDVEVWRSVDLGVTWTYAGTPAPHEPNTARMNHAAGLANNGDLLVICSGWLDDPPGSGFRSAILEPWLSRSTDGGYTWTIDETAVPYLSPRGYPIVPYGDIVEGADGILRAAVYDWPGYVNRDEKAYIIESSDGGSTWGNFTPLDTGNIRNETALMNLSGNNWLAVTRGGNEDMYWYLSSDNAATWAPQGQLTGYLQHPADLMRLADGRVLMTYSDRTDPQGVNVMVSTDEGVSWSYATRVCDYTGPDGGYPSTVQMSNGQMLTAFYAQGITGYSGYLMGAVTWDPASVPGEEEPPPPPRVKETVGYWRFNEKSPGQRASGTTGAIIDGSGKGHHGTAVGSPLPLYVSSPHDSPSALELTRGNLFGEDRVVVPQSTDFNFNLAYGEDFTVEAILRTNDSQGSGAIVSKRETTGPGWVVRLNTAGEVGIYLQGNSDFTYPDAHGAIDVADGDWHHVALVVDADRDHPENNLVRIYVDRSLDSEILLRDVSYLGTGIGEDLGNSHDLWIGDFIGRAEDQFVGDIDILRISSGALTLAEFLPFNQIAGDLNGDGHVGAGDLDIVRAHWGQAVPPGLWAQGDPSGDGLVGAADLDIVRGNWGNGTPPGPVPEPSAIVMLVGAGVYLLAFWPRRRRD